MDRAEILTNIGFILAGLFGGIYAYMKTKKPTPAADPVLAGVGIELGNRHQTDQLIHEVKRCADSLEILADREREEQAEKLDKILERLDRREAAAPRRRAGD